MSETRSRPLVTRTGLITGLVAFSLPFISDFIILGGSGQMEEVLRNPTNLIIFAIYTALAFWLLDSAMRPRRRVRIALWIGLGLTAALWLIFALTGLFAQTDKSFETVNIGLYMILMTWPILCAVIMGAVAKIGEVNHGA